MLLLLLRRFSRVRLCVTPQTAAPPGSSVHGILQARTLEWVASSFSNAYMHAKLLLSGPTLQSYEPQSPRLLCSWGFSRQEYWSGLPCPPPVDLPNPGIEPMSPTLQVDSLPSEPPGNPKKTGVGSLSLHQGILLTPVSAAAAKTLQSCPTLCDPIDSSPPGSPVPGFSRQEHWSGLPFPSPMHESEK